nr:aminotransferase class I/II-fold pyridoxal phosphate-dependent enzyme [Brevibacterium marinum]
MAKESATALQYTASAGLPGLRARIAERMSNAGAATDADDVLVLHGAQQGLDLVAKLLINRGDVIVTENPTSSSRRPRRSWVPSSPSAPASLSTRPSIWSPTG